MNKATISALVALPLVKLSVHLAVGNGYGYHGDELYYLACANHLDWGYVDHPPVSIVVLAAIRALAGDSVTAIRVVPAIAGSLAVLFVGLMTRRLGGGTFAVVLAMVATIAAPFYLVSGSYFSMNALDLLIWAIGGWLAIRIFTTGPADPAAPASPSTALWVALGIVLGIGLENKISVFWLGGGLLLGLLLTPHRSLLKTRGPWLAAGIAFLFFVPQIVWQLTHDFATLRWMKGAAEDRPSAPIAFLAGQINGMLRISAPVWIAGLVFFFVLPQGRRYRPLGWAWLGVCSLLTFSAGSRAYYLAPAYTWLMAGGAVAIESWLKSPWLYWIRFVYVGLIALRGLQASPFVMPIVPPATLAAVYPPPSSATPGVQGGIPQFLAQMSGFEEITGQLADIYDALPAAERERAMMLVAYYPIAGAIDVIGRDRGLPFASSSANSYWFWGPHGSWDGPIIALGYPEALLRDAFVQVERVGETHCDYCSENSHAVWVARGLRIPADVLWQRLKYRD